MKLKNLFRYLLIIGSIIFFSIGANAQFNSGSTGADGALDTSTMTCPSSICTVQLPESGILNYTTVNVGAGKELRFTNNSRNTPVTLLAQGSVTVSGVINVSSINDGGSNCYAWWYVIKLGNGGFRGGDGANTPGFGPGGGTSSQRNGRWVGPLTLVPIVGGSGGYKSPANGGGAITIASSSTITVTGQIWAQGSSEYVPCSPPPPSGSGGAMRLVSNSINASGSFSACGYNGNYCGVVRLEATNLTFTGASSPPAVLSAVNPDTGISNLPELRISSVGGSAVPTNSGNRFDTIDILLPTQLLDPINVVVSGVNIPVGTEIRVGFAAGSPSGASTPCSLAGTLGSSSCTIGMSNLNRSVITYLLATATFTPPGSLAQYNPNGPNQVVKVRLEAVLGANQRYVFLDSSEKVIETTKLRAEFLQFFGM